MKRPDSDSDSGSERFDASRFEHLPDCSLPEVAWMAGVDEEAMRRYLDEAAGAVIHGSISMTSLVRAAFTLLGRKENQSALLRLQLSHALERERELSETLSAGLLGTGVATPAIVKKVAKPAKKKKK
ncbi:MAG: hypothetical protein HQM02_04500 [Magnetococcales bacterium]|nr:hypothetical protein [Magnetococcales bacterium]